MCGCKSHLRFCQCRASTTPWILSRQTTSTSLCTPPASSTRSGALWITRGIMALLKTAGRKTAAPFARLEVGRICCQNLPSEACSSGRCIRQHDVTGNATYVADLACTSQSLLACVMTMSCHWEFWCIQGHLCTRCSSAGACLCSCHSAGPGGHHRAAIECSSVRMQPTE